MDRAKVPTIPEKEPVREPEKHLPALYVDVQTKTPAFVFALVALIDFISRWFYQDQINKALQRLTMLTELSGISLPELLAEPVSEETNANSPEPIKEKLLITIYNQKLFFLLFKQLHLQSIFFLLPCQFSGFLQPFLLVVHLKYSITWADCSRRPQHI